MSSKAAPQERIRGTPAAGHVRAAGQGPHRAEKGEQRWRMWRSRSAAKILSLACLVGAIVVEWMLVNVPVSEVSGQFPATVRARDEVVTFTKPTSITHDSFSLTYSPPTVAEKVLLDAYFDKAQLSDQTLQAFRLLGITAPSAPDVITYLTSGFGGASCATKLLVEPGSGNPKGVEFSQSGSDISSGYRTVGIRVSGAVANVTLTSQGAMQNGLSPCRIGLSVGDWKQSTQGFLPIKIQAPAGAPFRFHWQNLDERSSTWKTKSAALGLFEFGSSLGDEFLTQAIAITSVNPTTGAPEDPPSLEALGSKQSPLTVLSLGINQSQLEITASGKGRVRRHGTLVRTNILQRVDEYPIPSALFGAANLALIGWVKRAYFPGRASQRESSGL
jgi:hypothetical protein